MVASIRIVTLSDENWPYDMMQYDIGKTNS